MSFWQTLNIPAALALYPMDFDPRKDNCYRSGLSDPFSAAVHDAGRTVQRSAENGRAGSRVCGFNYLVGKQ